MYTNSIGSVDCFYQIGWWLVVYSLSHIQLYCNCMDFSLPASSVRGISQVRILEWVAISFFGDLPHLSIKPRSPVLQEDSFQMWDKGHPCKQAFNGTAVRSAVPITLSACRQALAMSSQCRSMEGWPPCLRLTYLGKVNSTSDFPGSFHKWPSCYAVLPTGLPPLLHRATQSSSQ